MLHLAIECSALAGSVAVLQQQTVIAERSLPPAVGSVQTLAPTIVELLAHHLSGKLPTVELISVTHGPGSFTGLRGGLALAKMLGLAWQIPIVAVDTLHVIAAQTAHDLISQRLIADDAPDDDDDDDNVVVAVLNAFRKQVFASAWRILSDSPPQTTAGLIPLALPQVLAAELWQTQPLKALECTQDYRISRGIDMPHARPALWISGAGLRNYTPQLDDRVNLADPARWDPTAAWVGKLGWNSYLAGNAISAAQLAPNYVRSSAAEETRDARGQ